MAQSNASTTQPIAKAKGLRRSWPIFALALFGTLSLLIWTRLRVVGGVPRTAYADPEQQQPEAHPKVMPTGPAQTPGPEAQPPAPKAAAPAAHTPTP